MDGLPPGKIISIVLPAYNEEANLHATVASALEVLSRFSLQFEILIVDDGAQDRTREISQLLESKYHTIKTLRHDRNRGYGAALRTGFSAARGELVFFMDSDGQFDLGDIVPFLKEIDSVDMVVGYRARRQDPTWRKLNSRIGNLLARIFLGVRVRDINCAFKLFRRNRLACLPLASEGAFINTELLAFAQAFGWTLKELPVRHYPRTAGKPTGGNPWVILKTFREYFELRSRITAFSKQAKSIRGNSQAPATSRPVAG